jgi:hypothetical protein
MEVGEKKESFYILGYINLLWKSGNLKKNSSKIGKFGPKFSMRKNLCIG